MTQHIILSERRTWPADPKPEDVEFRLLGRLLSRKPWIPGLFEGRYSYADHLINLHDICPPDFQLEALLMFAHAPFDEPVMALMEQNGDAYRFTAKLRPLSGTDMHINAARACIRQACGLEPHPNEATLTFLLKAQRAMMQAELRDMTHGLGSTIFHGAAQTKQPVMPRSKESAAAIWADKVENYIPERIAARNPERFAS